MTEERRKAKVAMLEQGVTFAQLEKETGLTRGTIHNVLSGVCSSARTRQALTDALGVQLWRDVKVQTARTTIAEGTVFLRMNREEAEALQKNFPSTTRVVLSGGEALGPWMVEFLSDTPAIVSVKNPASLPEPT